MDIKKLQLATTVEHEIFDGSTVKCTLAMYQLKRLASKDKKLYELVMKVMSGGTNDIFESVRVLYAAYLCANMDNDEVMTEDDFVMACGSDYIGIGETIKKLMNPKNRVTSAERSS